MNNETRTLIERMKAVSERVHQGNSRRRDSQRIEDAIIYIKYLESKLAAAEALQEFVDRIESQQATIAEQRSEVEFMQNNWVNPTGE